MAVPIIFLRIAVSIAEDLLFSCFLKCRCTSTGFCVVALWQAEIDELLNYFPQELCGMSLGFR